MPGQPGAPTTPAGPQNPEPNPASPAGPQPPIPPANPDMPAPGSEWPTDPTQGGSDTRTVPQSPRTPDDGSGTVTPTRDTPGAVSQEGGTPTDQPRSTQSGTQSDSTATPPTSGNADFAQSDKDGDGSLNMMEFASMMTGQGTAIAKARTSKKANNAATEALNKASARFLELDSNKDGRLSQEEAAAQATAPNTSL